MACHYVLVTLAHDFDVILTWDNPLAPYYSKVAPYDNEMKLDMVLISYDDVIKWKHLSRYCAGNSPVPGEFPTQRPVTRTFDVFFDMRLNTRLSKQWWGWWFETLSCSSWRHRNEDNQEIF